MKVLLAINLGSSFVSICRNGEGLAFKEPSLFSIKGSSQNYSVVAIGKEAKKLELKNPDGILTFSPIENGLIKSLDYTKKYLQFALPKVLLKENFKQISALISVPTGASQREIEKFKKCCYDAGIGEVKAIPSILCDSMAIFKKPTRISAQLVINIGGNCTNIAVVDGLKIIKGATVGLGGKTLDMHISNMVYEKYNANISDISAEKIKIELASMLPNDEMTDEIVAVDDTTKTLKKFVVFSKDIREVFVPFFAEIIKLIKTTIFELPESLRNEVLTNKIFITGGVSKLTGLTSFLTKQLNIPVILAENPENTTIYGLDRMFEYLEELDY